MCVVINPRTPLPSALAYAKSRRCLSSAPNICPYSGLSQALRGPNSVWYRTDAGTGPVDHAAAEHHVDFFNFDLAGICSFTVSPLELMLRSESSPIRHDQPKAAA